MTQPLPECLSSCDHVRGWLCDPLPPDVSRSLVRLCNAEDVHHVAVMPDVHLAQDVCIGTVVATERVIYPCAVGSDIGCGMAAIAFDATADLLSNDRSAATILAGLYESIPTNKHPRQNRGSTSPVSEHLSLSAPSLAMQATRDGRLQQGTLGRGNHFVELQTDTDGRLWLMVHSGSRGMGQAISRFHGYRTRRDLVSRLDCFDADSDAGQAYLNDVAWAVAYAKVNRLSMIEAVTSVLRKHFSVAADQQTLIHSDHNHVRREIHAGHYVWIHRKGALSAADGEPGVIPGSMGTRSYHTQGRGEPSSLCSSSHGAGRSMSRSEAVRAVRLKDFERQMQGVWYDRRRAVRLRDEAPSAYKDISQVMRAQNELTRITRELRPLLCYKGV